MSGAPDPRTLERIGADLGCTPVVTGTLDSISNSAWRIELGDRVGVLRTHTLDFGPPVTSHERELALHRLAASAGLAPVILWADTDAGLLVTEFEPAGTFAKQAAREPRAIEAIAEALARLHTLAVPPDVSRCRIVDAADTYVRRAGVGAQTHPLALVELVRDVETGADPNDDVLCHRDLLHANILASDPVRFIDWEFASAGERWFDLASFAVWQDLDRVQRERLLAAYLGRPPADWERERVARNVLAFNALCTLWSLPPAGGG